MKSKQQKAQDLQYGKEMAQKASSLVLVDFTKTNVNNINGLRRVLQDAQSTMKIIKKTLLGIIFKESNIDIDITQFDGQVGAVFSQKEISDTAGVIARFAKEKGDEMKDFALLAGFDVVANRSYDSAQIVQIGNLPSREVLLGQLVGMIAAPLRSLIYILSQIGSQSTNLSSDQPSAVASTEENPSPDTSSDSSPDSSSDLSSETLVKEEVSAKEEASAQEEAPAKEE